MSAALLDAAKSGATNHEVLSRAGTARAINDTHGGPVIAAWEVDQLPDTWIDAFTSMRTELQGLTDHFRKLENDRETWRKQNNYRM